MGLADLRGEWWMPSLQKLLPVPRTDTAQTRNGEQQHHSDARSRLQRQFGAETIVKRNNLSATASIRSGMAGAEGRAAPVTPAPMGFRVLRSLRTSHERFKRCFLRSAQLLVKLSQGLVRMASVDVQALL